MAGRVTIKKGRSQSIVTQYHGPTNSRGSRISATSSSGDRVYISYPHELNSEDAHASAAVALADKMGWNGTLCSGGLKNGYVFVFC